MSHLTLKSLLLLIAVFGIQAIVFTEKDLKNMCKLSGELVLSGLDEYDTAGIMEETIEENYGPVPTGLNRGLGDKNETKIKLNATEELMVRQLITELTDTSMKGRGGGAVNNYYQGATIVKIITKIMQKKGSMSVINNNVATQQGTVTSNGVEVSNSMNKNLKGYQKFIEMSVEGPNMKIDVPNLSRGVNDTLRRTITDAKGLNIPVPSKLKVPLPMQLNRGLTASPKPATTAAKHANNKRIKREVDPEEMPDLCDELIFPNKMDSSNHEAWFQGLLTISDQILTLRKIHNRPHEIVRHINGAVLEERNGKVFPRLQNLRFGVARK